MVVLFTILGVLADLLIQMFTLLGTGAVVASVVRGFSAEDGVLLLLFLAATIGGHWILIRRIRAGRRTVATARAGSEEVGTRTPGHFITDALLILGLAAMLRTMQEPPWGTAERAGMTAMLVACIVLCGLRLAFLRRDPDPDLM